MRLWNKPTTLRAKGRGRFEVLEPRYALSYTPLAPTTQLAWTTGYFTATGTVDLQAGAALAPELAADEAAALPREIMVSASGLPLLQSRPNGEGLELFIDFSRDVDGRGTFSLDADRPNFNFQEQLAIFNCWRNLVGYFSPFNINVTTVLPATGAADPNFGWIQITNDWVGGNAYVGWLAKDGPKGTINSGDAVNRVSGVAHELGHILGLNHQANYDINGNITAEYSNGDGYRNVPLMGVDYNGQPSSKLFYGRPSNGTQGWAIQDDVQVIANTVTSVVGGDGFRPDDFGNTLATAFTLAADSQQRDGFLERYADVDVFKITPTVAGSWNITASPLYDSQAQPKLELLDASGNVIAARDDASLRNGPTNEQFLNVTLAAGTYYVRVSSSGDYGELGYYKFAASQLPSFFVSNDIGVPAVSGSVTYDAATGTFTQSTGGTDIWNASDQFRFTYATLTGNGSITARVDSLDNIGTYTKAGVMIRQSLDANSPHAYVGLLPSGAIESIRRLSAGATAVSGNNPGAGPWVRLTRTSGLITYYSSVDGTTWTTLGSATINMSGPVLIGLATTAWNPQYEAFATFSNVTVTGNVTPAAPTYNALAAPAALTATPASGANSSIDLAWSAVAGATGYRIERSVDGINFSTLTNVAAGATSYTDVNPWGSMRWFYRVSAANNTSLYSAPSVIASAVNKPNAPYALGYTAAVISPGRSQMFLNFGDVQGETGYRVERSVDGVNYTFVADTASNQTSVNITGSAYKLRITPLTNIGDGAARSLVVTNDTLLPAVANLRFTARTSTAMTIAWDDAANETGYRVERSTDGVNWAFMGDTASGVTTYTSTGLTAGSEYYFRVMAWNGTYDGVYAGPIFAAAPAASLPPGWTNSDIGSVAGAGAALASGSDWTVVTGGNDLLGTADALNYTYRSLNATADTNFTLVARIDGVENTHDAAKAGLVLRQSLAANSKSVAIMLNSDGGYGIDVRTRTTVGGGTAYQQVLPNIEAPYWLRISRAGSTIAVAYSIDGTQWTDAATVNGFSLTGTFYAGLAATSASTTQLNTATFSHVEFTGLAGTPTVALPASATPNTVSGLTTALAALGADESGEEALTYTWSADGPAPVSFAENGTNAAKNTMATFAAAGTYQFTVTIADATGLSVTSQVAVEVNQVLGGVLATLPTMAVGTSQQMQLADQFGDPLASSPTVTWTTTAGTITPSGVLTAPTAATASVKVTAEAASGTYSGYVAVADALAWYKANEAVGSTLADATLAARTGTLTGAYSFSDGVSGNGLQLSGGHASLPAGIVSNVTSFTVATWIKADSLDTWSRIFDFGTGTNSYMFLSPKAGGTNALRFSITNTGGGGEQQLNGPVLNTGTWYHIAVTLGRSGATMYVNGTAVATSSTLSLRPVNLGTTTQNYLGKSQYPDPAFQGTIDDFRLYSRALPASEIAALAAPVIITPATPSAAATFAPTVELSVLAMDQTLGEAGLTYTWSVTGTPPAPVAFTTNGSNYAKQTVATFSESGSYTLQVTALNPETGRSTNSNTTVTASLVAGDYNYDGQVDNSDYDVWRANFGAEASAGTLADGNRDGRVDIADYTIWRDNLGNAAAASVVAALADAAEVELMEAPPAASLQVVDATSPVFWLAEEDQDRSTSSQAKSATAFVGTANSLDAALVAPAESAVATRTPIETTRGDALRRGRHMAFAEWGERVGRFHSTQLGTDMTFDARAIWAR